MHFFCKIFILYCLSFIVLPFAFALAQGTQDPSQLSKYRLNAVANEAGFEASPEYRDGRGLQTMLLNIFNIFLSVLGLGFFGITMYGGYLWATAGGNERQIEEARKWIINGVIGVLIIMSAYGIAVFVEKSVTDSVTQYEYE